MRPFANLAPLIEARELAERLARPSTVAEEIALEDALDRVLAMDALSRIDVPSADRAAMDGYAVCTGDGLRSGARLRRSGRVVAGQGTGDHEVTSDSCVEIATGAPIPEGCDAVVPVEHTDRQGDDVILQRDVRSGQHISRRGEDLQRGRAIGKAGAILGPPLVAACAAGGRDHVRVHGRPRVLVAPTGDEIVALGRELEPGQVYDSNAVGVAALLSRTGALPERTPVIVDERQRLVETLTREGFDLMVTIGGTSVGRRDLVSDALQECGEILVHGVAVKPGKPLLLGRVGATPVVGLPGFPTTCLMLAHAIVAPMVRALGHRPLGGPTMPAILDEDVRSPPDKTHLLPVVIEDGAARSTFRSSSAVSSLARATGWIEIPEGTDRLAAGEPVTVHLF